MDRTSVRGLAFGLKSVICRNNAHPPLPSRIGKDWHRASQEGACEKGGIVRQISNSPPTGDEGYRMVIHDRDSIYSKGLDVSLKTLGLLVLKTPYESPQANSFCERLIGTARRECLGFHDSDQ